MASYKVGILGATGAVGEQMRIVLAERKFPISELRLFGSARSAGKVINYEGQDIVVQEASLEAFKGLDLLLGAADNPVAKQFLPEAAKMGIHVVDNSSAFRLDPDVPLVIPEVNPEDVKLSKGLIANPNCATIIGLTAVNSLHRHAPIRRMVVSTYQAVSGAGKAGIDALEAEVKAANGQRAEGSCFPYPIAYNLIPQIGGFNEMGYSSEEMKMQNEGRRILHDEALQVSCTCVRVPVYRCHSESIYVETETEVSLDAIRQAAEECPGLVLNEAPYPTPKECTDSDAVVIGRLRQDGACKQGLHLWWGR